MKALPFDGLHTKGRSEDGSYVYGPTYFLRAEYTEAEETR